MEPFIPEPIKDIILRYLNLHELYIEELKIKTLSIHKSMEKYDPSNGPSGDCGYDGTLMIIKCDYSWKIGSDQADCLPKNSMVRKLNKRANKRNEIFGIVKTDKYGMYYPRCLAFNFCYTNY